MFIGKKKSLASSIHNSLKPSSIFKNYCYFDHFQPGTEAQVSRNIYMYYWNQSLFSKTHQHMLSSKYFSLGWIFSCSEPWPQWMLPFCPPIITARALKPLALWGATHTLWRETHSQPDMDRDLWDASDVWYLIEDRAWGLPGVSTLPAQLEMIFCPSKA